MGCLFKAGDRVVYNQPTHIHKGALPYKAKSLATVLAVFGGDGSRQNPTYQLELDEVWTLRENRMFVGQKIVVGNVFEQYLEPVPK